MSFDHKITKISLFILPTLVCAAGLALILRMYPLHINSHTGFGQDPAYQYLFAGVDILLGNSPVHTDHPGTPLQTLIAAITAIAWLFYRGIGVTSVGLFESVLRTPEWFLVATSLSLLAFTCIALYKLGSQIFRLTCNLPLALSCQVTPLLYQVVVPNVIFPTPEALLISVSTAFVIVIAPLVLSRDSLSQKRLNSIAVWSGVLSGIGIAVKITFVPSLCLLLLLRRPQLILKAVIVSSIAWFIGVLPILPRLAGMFQWFFNVLTHSGIHGQGPDGLFDWARLKLAVGWLVDHFGIFYFVTAGVSIVFIVLFVGLVSDHYRNNSKFASKVSILLGRTFEVSRGGLWIACIFLLAAITQTLMVAKHVGPSYMVPALAISCLAFVWLTQQSKLSATRLPLRQVMSWSWLTFVCLVSIFSFSQSLNTVSIDHHRGLKSHDQIVSEIDKFTNPIILGTFNCNFLSCARWFGMSLVPEMERRMSSVDINFLYFDIFSKKLHTPGVGELSSEETAKTVNDFIAQSRPVLLIAPPYPQLNALTTQLILSTPVQNLYQVTGVR